MSPFILGCIGVTALVVIIFLRIPIGMSMLAVGAVDSGSYPA